MAKVVITEELLMEYSQSSNRITSDQRRAIVHYLAENPHELERVMQMTAQALEIGVKRAPSSTDRLSDSQSYVNGLVDDKMQFRDGLEELYDSLSDRSKMINSSENNPFQKAAERVSRVINPFRRGIAALFDDDQQSVAACKSEDDKSSRNDKKHH